MSALIRTLCLAALLALPLLTGAAPAVEPPRTGITPAELGVVINDADPVSRAIGAHYIERRGIPPENAIHVRFEPDTRVLDPKRFQAVKAAVDAQAGNHIQALALTWTTPYRVGCMSITSAFAFGFDAAFCARGCKQTRPSPYFNSPSTRPWTDLGIRPTMALAARNLRDAATLIERGIAADGSRPSGTAYLLSTSDAARNTRAPWFPLARRLLAGVLDVQVLERDTLRDRHDVLFYFTGRVRVPDLDRLRFLPGAMADHLTSKGGQLAGSDQMSAGAWIEAGATGSYGTVVEPCNFPQKFPHPAVAMAHYVSGATLVEAYWKSVAQPGQGIFIGEPLARPWGGSKVTVEDSAATVALDGSPPGLYLLVADDGAGPYRIAASRWAPALGARRWRFEGLSEGRYLVLPVHTTIAVIPN